MLKSKKESLHKNEKGDSMQTQNTETINERNADLKKWAETVENENTRNYINIRIIPQMQYYNQSSRKNKKQYLSFKKLAIILGALIPVATLFSDCGIWGKLVIVLFGTSLSAITAYLELQNSEKLWILYRVKREQLLEILMYYFTNAGNFATISDQRQKDALLVEICEQYMSEEYLFWKGLVDTNSNSGEKDLSSDRLPSINIGS